MVVGGGGATEVVVGENPLLRSTPIFQKLEAAVLPFKRLTCHQLEGKIWFTIIHESFLCGGTFQMLCSSNSPEKHLKL